MSLWEAFCERFGGKEKIEIKITEAGGVITVINPRCRVFRFTMQQDIQQDWFERDPEDTIDYMTHQIEEAARRANRNMKDELKKLRSTGQKNGVT